MMWAMASTDPATALTLDELGDGLGAATTVVRANATAAGLGAPVPTCPGWTVLDLVTHLGMVHRWATAHVRGDAPAESSAALMAQGRSAPDVLGWFDDGATALLQAIVDAPDAPDALDALEASVFLPSAPPPRLFWTRRQCHESTIHAVDALSARLGRPARPDETWIRPAVALDGIDELLRGWLCSRDEGVPVAQPTTVLVCPDGSPTTWRVELAPGSAAKVSRLHDGPDDPSAVGHSSSQVSGSGAEAKADHVLTGPAVALYLGLWHRGSTGDEAFDDWWRERMRIAW